MEKINVICKNEPKGSFGLEGYQQGEEYVAQIVFQHSEGESCKNKKYYRVWPVKSDPSYYETCSVNAFNKFFTNA